jgi:hypothetical protein
MPANARWGLSFKARELLENELPDFDAERARKWPAGLGRIVLTAELSRWLRLPYHEVRNLVLDGVLMPEAGIEPPQFHLAANVQRYCVYLRLKALARYLA